MSETIYQTPEEKAAAAFTKQSAVFDDLYGEDGMIRYKRNRVREHLLSVLKPQSHVLELNCGTGEDACWLAAQAHSVFATDIAAGMLAQANRKIREAQLDHLITTQLLSFTELDQLAGRQQFDHIFSNFAGLNCTGELEKVLHSFSSLLRPGGRVTLVLLPSFCLWETLLVFRGKFKTAFRRFFARKGRKARVEGMDFRCWYYNASTVKRMMQEEYRCIGVEGLCTIVPPSYIEGFDQQYPKLFHWLADQEGKRKKAWPWRSIGDYYIISFEKIR